MRTQENFILGPFFFFYFKQEHLWNIQFFHFLISRYLSPCKTLEKPNEQIPRKTG